MNPLRSELNGAYVLRRLGRHLDNRTEFARLDRQFESVPVLLEELGIVPWRDLNWYHPPFARQTIERLASRKWLRLAQGRDGLLIIVTRVGMRQIERARFPSLSPHRPRHAPTTEASNGDRDLSRIRELWDVESCSRKEVPAWLKEHLRVKHPGLHTNEAIEKFLGRQVIDHFGTLPDGRFVSEPYFNRHQLTLIQDAVDLANEYDLDLTWSLRSWHHPGETIRLIFDHSTRAAVGS